MTDPKPKAMTVEEAAENIKDWLGALKAEGYPITRYDEDTLATLEALAEENARLNEQARRDADIEGCLRDENAALKAEAERLKRPIGFHDVDEFYPEDKESTMEDWKARAKKAEAELAAAKTKCERCPFGTMLKEYQEDDDAALKCREEK